MDRATELAIIKRAYAKQVLAEVQVDDPRVEAAFAAVPREHFLGPGPWPILRWLGGYLPTPSDDPVYLYADILVGILPERHLNNGQPSYHALLIASAAPQPGEHVVHVGAGVGYFSAIFAALVGPSGSVTAIEFDPGLATRAASNFGTAPNVNVIPGDGALVAFATADVIYVNAGATRPAESWLDRLNDRGNMARVRGRCLATGGGPTQLAESGLAATGERGGGKSAPRARGMEWPRAPAAVVSR